MLAEPIFLFGTLCHLPLLQTVAGGKLQPQAATLSGHRIAHAVSPSGEQKDFPVCVAQPGATAQGMLVFPDEAQRQRLSAYERVFCNLPEAVRVETDAGVVGAIIYLPQDGGWSAGGDWSLDEWVAQAGYALPEAADQIMALLETHAPEIISQRLGMLRSRIASRHRAISEPAPASLRRQSGVADVEIQALRMPYARFFGVEEADLRFRAFDGGLSQTVTRAGFIMADAATVLPYDPQLDAVMLVEQFRFGPYARGDRNPWSLEPVAGRIDPGETPEAAVRREAREEAALELRELHLAGRYYVSPGAITEYILSYIGLADLPQSAQGIHGLESEAEDIRSHIIPFARLMELVESGEVETAPLLISAQWLAANRKRLRAGG